MKLNKRFYFLVLLLTAFMQNSCEHEINEDSSDTFSFKTHTYNQAIAIKDFKKSYSIFQSELSNFKKKSKTTESMSDFEIDSTTINEIRVGAITTYTMLVKKKSSDKDNSFENLILKIDDQGNTKAYILKYFPNEDMTYVPQHDSYTFKGTKELREISFNSKINAKSTINTIHLPTVQSEECTMVLMCSYGGHEHTAGNCSKMYWVIDCRSAGGGSPSGSGGSDGGGATTGSGNTSSGGSSNYGGGSGTGSTSTGSSTTGSTHNTAAVNGEIPTATVIPYKSLDVASLLSLTIEQKNWLNNIKQLPIKKELQQYLYFNNTAENYDFAKQFITQSILNPNLKLDFKLSLKSPAFIDFSSIDLNTPEGQKFNEVYNKLTNTPLFKNLFLNLFSDSTRFNVKFELSTSVKGNGVTEANLKNPTLNLIKIKPQFLLNSSKVEIAKTIIHECIHAFLNVKLCEPNIGMSIPSINNMDLYSIINQQYGGFIGGQTQHNFIYKNLLPIMTQILSDVKAELIIPSQIEALEKITLHPPSKTPNPTVNFNWDHFLLNVSLGGLQNCEFFQNEIGTITVINGIATTTNIVDQDKLYYYNAYNYYMDEILKP